MKTFDITNWCCCAWFCMFGAPYRQTLNIDEEECSMETVNCCGTIVSRYPYGEIGSVTKGSCCGCVSFSSVFGDISPGCGCSYALVDEIVSLLQTQVRERGDIAQIKKADQQLEMIKHLQDKVEMMNEKLDRIMAKME